MVLSDVHAQWATLESVCSSIGPDGVEFGLLDIELHFEIKVLSDDFLQSLIESLILPVYFFQLLLGDFYPLLEGLDVMLEVLDPLALIVDL